MESSLKASVLRTLMAGEKRFCGNVSHVIIRRRSSRAGTTHFTHGSRWEKFPRKIINWILIKSSAFAPIKHFTPVPKTSTGEILLPRPPRAVENIFHPPTSACHCRLSREFFFLFVLNYEQEHDERRSEKQFKYFCYVKIIKFL